MGNPEGEEGVSVSEYELRTFGEILEFDSWVDGKLTMSDGCFVVAF